MTATHGLDPVLGLSGAALDRLMPMHLWVTQDGRVLRMGPTLARVLGADAVRGRDLFDLVTLRRPAGVATMAALALFVSAPIKLSPKAQPDLALRGMCVALPGEDGMLLNLSPGAGLRDVIQRFDLTLADFAPTDLTAELLFLIEANASAFAEQRRLNTCLEGAKTKAETEALTDTLTGLRNRRAMDKALAAQTAQGHAEQFGVMHIDLDYFKSVNDSLGHAAGDKVLVHAAHILTEETRRDDLVARVGGDEFVVLIRDCVDLDILSGIAERIITRLEAPIDYNGQPCRISASIGVTVSSYYDDLLPDRLLSDADEATYLSKSKGRGQHTVFQPKSAPTANPKGQPH